MGGVPARHDRVVRPGTTGTDHVVCGEHPTGSPGGDGREYLLGGGRQGDLSADGELVSHGQRSFGVVWALSVMLVLVIPRALASARVGV